MLNSTMLVSQILQVHKRTDSFFRDGENLPAKFENLTKYRPEILRIFSVPYSALQDVEALKAFVKYSKSRGFIYLEEEKF